MSIFKKLTTWVRNLFAPPPPPPPAELPKLTRKPRNGGSTSNSIKQK